MFKNKPTGPHGKKGGVLLEMGETVTKTNFQTVGLLEKGVDREV